MTGGYTPQSKRRRLGSYLAGSLCAGLTLPLTVHWGGWWWLVSLALVCLYLVLFIITLLRHG